MGRRMKIAMGVTLAVWLVIAGYLVTPRVLGAANL